MTKRPALVMSSPRRPAMDLKGTCAEQQSVIFGGVSRILLQDPRLALEPGYDLGLHRL